jgi:hypothetical protein
MDGEKFTDRLELAQALLEIFISIDDFHELRSR